MDTETGKFYPINSEGNLQEAPKPEMVDKPPPKEWPIFVISEIIPKEGDGGYDLTVCEIRTKDLIVSFGSESKLPPIGHTMKLKGWEMRVRGWIGNNKIILRPIVGRLTRG